MLVTLFTDASRDPETGISGWAAWAKLNGETMRRSSGFKLRTVDSLHAEVAALVNGLHAVMKFWPDCYRAKIIAQTDNKQAIRILANHQPDRLDRHLQIARDAWVAMKSAKELQIDLRHVKGHRGFNSPRSAVNTWCDEAAKAHMRRIRDEYRNAYQHAMGKE